MLVDHSARALAGPGTRLRKVGSCPCERLDRADRVGGADQPSSEGLLSTHIGQQKMHFFFPPSVNDSPLFLSGLWIEREEPTSAGQAWLVLLLQPSGLEGLGITHQMELV